MNSIKKLVTLFFFIIFYSGCVTSPPKGDEFGNGLCECVQEAKGNRKVFDTCVAVLSKRAIPFFRENGKDSNVNRREWKQKMFENAQECKDELRKLGFNIDAFREDWSRKR